MYERDRKWGGTSALGWLGHIARYLRREETQDLEWWRLGEMLSLRARVLAVMGVVGMVAMVVDWCVEAPLALVSGAPWNALGALLNGALTGILFGLVFGFLVAFAETSGRGKPGYSAVALRPLSRMFHEADHRGFGVRRHVNRGVSGLLMGLGGGIVYGAGFAVLRELIVAQTRSVTPGSLLIRVVKDAALFGVLFGVAAGAGFLVISLREVPVRESRADTPLGLLRLSRVITLRQVPVLALAETAGIIALGFLAGQLPGVRMPPVFVIDIGLVAGISGTLAYILVFTAWGQWLIMARVALPVARRLPRKLISFLEDSHDLGILRHSGVAYQFSHVRLRDTLAGPDASE